MNIIVFSKDRACQLELFLRSMSIYFNEFGDYQANIIYKTSNDVFAKGYLRLIESHKASKNIKFIEQKDSQQAGFQELVLRCIDGTKDCTVFFTDDDIWINYFSITNVNFKHFKSNNELLCFSLRLNTKLKYCYPTSSAINILPRFNSFNAYAHAGTQGYYNYPMSVNGHIFKTKDILPLLQTLKYDNPNWLEYQLALNPIKKNYINCCTGSIIVNNPCSVVQTICKNRNENLDNNWINEQYLNNKLLSMDMVENIAVESCHQPIKLIFK